MSDDESKTLEGKLPKKVNPIDCRMQIVGSAQYCPTGQTICKHIGEPANYFAKGYYTCRKPI